MKVGSQAGPGQIIPTKLGAVCLVRLQSAHLRAERASEGVMYVKAIEGKLDYRAAMVLLFVLLSLGLGVGLSFLVLHVGFSLLA